jgi:adenosine deaminase
MNKKVLFERMRAFPKVDLHRHLEGAITAETLVRIAKKYGGALPAATVSELRPYVQMDLEIPSFTTFLKKFLVYRGFYTCREAIQEIAYAAVQDAALDNVKYLELRYSPSHFAGTKFSEADVTGWIHSAIGKASADYSIIVVPILTISRDYGLELASKTVRYAASLEQGFFRGLDIAGDEVANSAQPFCELFALAKKSGLKLTIHAGEAGDPDNVRQAVVDFAAERIGHGVRSIENIEVMHLLRDQNILLELCLTSNVHTAVIPAIEAHPIRKFMEFGIPVSINTDDPAISAITLSREYVEAVTRLGFTEAELKQLNLQALEHAFYPDTEELKSRIAHLWR